MKRFEELDIYVKRVQSTFEPSAVVQILFLISAAESLALIKISRVQRKFEVHELIENELETLKRNLEA